jgi:hypothetical protein
MFLILLASSPRTLMPLGCGLTGCSEVQLSLTLQQGSYNSAFGADQLIRGVQTFRDPSSGATFELSNQYDHAWLNGSNEYVMSDDPNFCARLERGRLHIAREARGEESNYKKRKAKNLIYDIESSLVQDDVQKSLLGERHNEGSLLAPCRCVHWP